MSFSKNTFAFDLDIKRQSKTKVFPVEGDTANQFVITLKDNGAAMNLTGLYVRAVYKRSDGVVVTQGETHPDAPLSVNKASGVVTVDVINGAFRDGDNYLELQVLSGSATSGTVMVTSPQVLLRARNCILTDDAVAASSEISELNEYLNALANMGITVTMLAANASPTGSLTIVDGAYQIALGIPRGAKITSASLSGTTLTFSLDDGSSVSVTLTGLATQAWVNTQGFLKAPIINSEMEDMDGYTIKGNNTASTTSPKDLTKAEIKAMFPMSGATGGAAGSSGFVPAPAAGDNTKFLAGDGTYKKVPGSDTEDIEVVLDPNTVSLTALSNGDFVAKAMTLINLLITNKLDTDGDGNAVTVQRNASYNYSDIPTTAITLQQLLAYLGGWYAEINGKQDELTAGSGISIVNNVISATGGGGGVTSVNGQTGAVTLSIPSTAADVGAIAAPSSPTVGDVVTYNGTAWVAGQAGLSSDAKDALIALLEKVAYIDEHGQDYLDDFEDALNGKTLSSITAVFTPGGATIYDTDTLDDLKQYLVVTAHYSDNSTATVTTYTLSGTLAVGTDTITVTYRSKTATFTVTVVSYSPFSFTGGVSLASVGGTIFRTDNNTTARACMDEPIANNGYSFAVTDSSKYALAVNGVSSLTHVAITEQHAVDGYGFKRDGSTASWATSGSTQASYVWVALKKNDGTAFTSEELANGASAVLTYTENA